MYCRNAGSLRIQGIPAGILFTLVDNLSIGREIDSRKNYNQGLLPCPDFTYEGMHLSCPHGQMDTIESFDTGKILSKLLYL
jgi:hypothetical protein